MFSIFSFIDLLVRLSNLPVRWSNCLTSSTSLLKKLLDFLTEFFNFIFWPLKFLCHRVFTLGTCWMVAPSLKYSFISCNYYLLLSHSKSNGNLLGFGDIVTFFCFLQYFFSFDFLKKSWFDLAYRERCFVLEVLLTYLVILCWSLIFKKKAPKLLEDLWESIQLSFILCVCVAGVFVCVGYKLTPKNSIITLLSILSITIFLLILFTLVILLLWINSE